MLRFLLITSLLVATSCGPRSVYDTKGLDTENSNINNDIKAEDVTELKLLPNTYVPKGFVVFLGEKNYEFIKDLYNNIRQINVAENLSGLEGYNQEITMVVVGRQDEPYFQLTAELKAELELPESAAVPYLQRIKGVTDFDPWMQDWGEFAAVQTTDSEAPVYAVMDGGRDRGINPNEIAEIFNIPVLRLTEDENTGSGNYGGNTEATHEGILYYGDRLTDEAMRSRLEKLGNTDAIEIPSDWLGVGHVDEYTTFIPSNGVCGATLVVASPLEGLNLFWASNDEELEAAGFPNLEFMQAAISALLKPEATIPYSIEEFDLQKASATPGSGWVRRNLEYELYSLQAAETLLNASTCKPNVVSIPQVFDTENGRAGATFGGATNMLVLRDHLIIPEAHIHNQLEPFTPFQNRITETLSAEVGGAEKIHFIDTTYYHTRSGEIHCGTNVVRELDMVFKVEDQAIDQ